MARFGPTGAVVIVDIPLNVPDGNIVPKPVLKDLLYQFFLVDRLQHNAGRDLKMPAVGRDFATTDFHIFFRRVSAALCDPFFSGNFFMLGVSFAQRFATSGSRAKRYRAWAFDLNGMDMGGRDCSGHKRLAGNVKEIIKKTMSQWDDAQKFEEQFWGNCVNTFSEELKQRVYADYMGLPLVRTGPHGFGYDLRGKRILDIGGGPVSILLKSVNCTGSVVDPCRFPDWVSLRYATNNIAFYRRAGEDVDYFPRHSFDEVWIYNVLQHTDDPGKIIANAKHCAPRLRIFEWVDLPAYPGHPQEITQAKLETWIGMPGKVTEFRGENECHGKAFHGCFDHAGHNS